MALRRKHRLAKRRGERRRCLGMSMRRIFVQTGPMQSILNAWRSMSTELPANEIRELTAQFYVTLEAFFAKVKDNLPPRSQESFDRVSQLLETEPKERRNWTRAYAIEQLLIHLFDDETLASELQARVREARGSLKPALVEYYAGEAAKTTLSAAERRALLSRLVNDLQWRYTVDEVKRGYTKQITLQTGQMFVVSMIVFAISVLATLVYPALLQFDVRLLVPAVLAGCWGASFSLLGSLKDRLEASDLDALKVMRARWVLASRVLIGAGGASVLYFFFVSGMITGPAFPDLKSEAQQQAASRQRHAWAAQPSDPRAVAAPQAGASPSLVSQPAAALPDKQPPLDVFALLVVWCFVAGFSERLIPGLLAKAESKIDTAATPDRYRPGASGTDVPAPAPASTAAAASNGAS